MCFELLFSLSFLFTLVCRLSFVCNKLREEYECQNVGDYHEVIEHISNLPNKVVLEKSSEEDKSDSNDRVNDNRNLACLLPIAIVQ